MRFMLMVKAGANYEAGRPPDPALLAAIGALGRPLAPHELAILLPWGSETDSARWKTQGDWSPDITNLGDAGATPSRSPGAGGGGEFVVGWRQAPS
jgi:hypothetical protein